MSKFTCIITDRGDPAPPQPGVITFSNVQWEHNPAGLEGYEFGDVIVRCVPAAGLRHWLHVHLGIRIDRIIYERGG